MKEMRCDYGCLHGYSTMISRWSEIMSKDNYGTGDDGITVLLIGRVVNVDK